jgi:hypothetical protein
MKNYIGKQVGFVKINKPIVYTDRGYETAAWWEERTSITGVYSLFLQKKDQYSNDYNVVANIPATVSDDYFPALWGGVAISNEPYKSKNIGKPSLAIKVSSDLVVAIDKTGISPGYDIDWYVNPELWELVIKDREDQLNNSYNELPEWWTDYKSGDDKYHSKVSIIAHFGEKLTKYSREIELLYRRHGYLKEMSEMLRELHKNNTAWAVSG